MERNQQRINEQIRITPIRVITDTGEQLGIISTEDAMTRAREAGLDLVEVAPNERPPVCRIMDFGKFKYQKKKREHGQRKNSHHGRQKEIRLRPKTGDHDIGFKVSHAREFLEHRDKVIVSVIFRGRENAHADEEGRKVLGKFVSALDDIAKVESGPSKQGRRMICTLAPR